MHYDMHYDHWPDPGTATIVAAGLGAAGVLGSGALGSRSANRAARLQSQSTREALDFQRQQAAEEKARRDKQDAELLTAWNEHVARRRPYWERADRLISGRGYTPRARPTAPSAAFRARFSF